MSPKPPHNDEQSVARWLCAPEQTQAMIRRVLWVLASSNWQAPNSVRRALLADRALHEDLLAEARVTYLLRWREGKAEEGKELAFLKGITENTTRTIARTRARRQATAVAEDVAEVANLLPAGDPGQDDALAVRQQLLCVRTELDRLPPERRAAFVTAVFEGYDAAEQEHGMDRSTLRVLVHRVRKAIQGALTEAA